MKNNIQRNPAENIPHEKKVEGGKQSHGGSQGGKGSGLSQADRAKGGKSSRSGGH